MEARILKWKELAKKRSSTLPALDVIRHESNQAVANQRHADQIAARLKIIPVRFRGKSFDDYKIEIPLQKRAKMVAEKFVETFSKRLQEGTVLHFLGKPGTGKTFLSLLMYQSIVKNGFSAQYEPSTQFLKVLQEKRFESNAAYRSLLNHYRQIDFLILDEITESITKNGQLADVERALLLDVINARYEEKHRCTLIISNRDKSELNERLGNRIYDRLSENSLTLAFNWNSYRQHKEKTCY